MNANFTDVVNWAGGTPTLSTSGSNTTVSGTLTVVEGITSNSYIYLNGSNQTIQFEGSSADANETILAATNPTADRTITFPDATGTVALTSDITSTTWNDQNNIISNSIFN